MRRALFLAIVGCALLACGDNDAADGGGVGGSSGTVANAGRGGSVAGASGSAGSSAQTGGAGAAGQSGSSAAISGSGGVSGGGNDDAGMRDVAGSKADVCDTVCATGSHCELVKVECIRAPCPPEKMCVPSA